MRSSDWSSDVCSSDLAHTTPHQRGNRRVAGPPRRTIHHPPRARRTRAMSVIGTFTPVKDGGWAGTIRTLTIEVKARFRSEERRVGKEWGSTGRTRWARVQYKKKEQI